MTTIQLAKNLHEDKYKYPYMMSEKIDGCACEFWWEGARVVSRSRNHNTDYPSVQHIRDHLEQTMPRWMRLIGELFINGMHFKDSSGFIRANVPDVRVELGVYDVVHVSEETDTPFHDRYSRAVTYFPVWASPVFTIEQRRANCLRDIQVYEDTLRAEKPDVFEGLVLRDLYEVFHAGSRKMIRRTKDLTTDVIVTGFEEMVSKKTDLPMGMVGAVLFTLNGIEQKAGAGKMSHADRKKVWENQSDYVGLHAEIKHKRDTSYIKLRQPTFQMWRYDL